MQSFQAVWNEVILYVHVQSGGYTFYGYGWSELEQIYSCKALFN